MNLVVESVRGRWSEVDAYLLELERELAPATIATRERTMLVIEDQIRESLWGDSDEEDAPRVHATLREIGTPAVVASRVLQGREPTLRPSVVKVAQLPDESPEQRRAWRAVWLSLGAFALYWLYPVAVPLALAGLAAGMWGLYRRKDGRSTVEMAAVMLACGALFTTIVAGVYGLGVTSTNLGDVVPPPPTGLRQAPTEQDVPQLIVERDDLHGQ